jgi:murein DD-endopeptidase MepM/ murein hydrolase activator NlpD
MRFVLAAVGLFVAQAAPPPALTIAAAARSMQPGEVVVLTVSGVTPGASVRARAFDRDLRPFQDESRAWRVLVGIDLDVKPGTYPVTVEAGPAATAVRATYRLVVRSKAFRTRQLTVDNAFVNPPASAQERIAQDRRDLEQCWRDAAPTRLWSGAFVRPVPHEANSAFGSRSVFNGQARNPHTGADFLSPAGTPVLAPGGGRIALAKDLYFSGNSVVIDHGLGLFSMVAHLSAIGIKTGDIVAAGDVVGKVGATGRVTGPHLHWTVLLNSARVDPLSLLAVLGK